jgi:hypothetical protein
MTMELTWNLDSVDFCMFAFDVDFGASPHPPPPMSLLEFWKMLHKPGPNVQSNNADDADPPQSLLTYDSNTSDTQGPAQSKEEGAAFKFALEDGNFPMPSPKDTGTNPNGGPTSTGTGSKWFVKGGSLRFRVNSDFAISKATVTDTTVVAAPGDAVIYSRPMQVITPIASELVVTVKHHIDSTIQAGWQSAAGDMKQMPLAAFGQYDATKDPSIKGANTTDLLSNKAGMVSLMMGVVISAPLPILKESPIGLILNATNMMLAPIQDFRPPAPLHGKDWLLPPFEAAQSKYLPALLTAAETSEPNQDRWNGMRTSWLALASKETIVNDTTDGLLARCNEIFAWQKNLQQIPMTPTPGAEPPVTGSPAPAPTPTPTDPYQPWQLTGKLPTKLINDLEVWYLDLPRTAVVS